MKTITSKIILLIALFVSILSINSFGQFEQNEDKTLSPYFFIQSDEPGIDHLPLKSTSAVVNIAGVIADVKVRQVYKNEGQKTIEAIYIFPGSTRAAVYGMKMTIGERTIEAKIEERERLVRIMKRPGKMVNLLLCLSSSDRMFFR